VALCLCRLCHPSCAAECLTAERCRVAAADAAVEVSNLPKNAPRKACKQMDAVRSENVAGQCKIERRCIAFEAGRDIMQLHLAGSPISGRFTEPRVKYRKTSALHCSLSRVKGLAVIWSVMRAASAPSPLREAHSPCVLFWLICDRLLETLCRAGTTGGAR